VYIEAKYKLIKKRKYGVYDRYFKLLYITMNKFNSKKYIYVNYNSLFDFKQYVRENFEKYEYESYSLTDEQLDNK